MPRKKKDLILATFEKKLGPAAKWAGNCFGIATKAVEQGLVPKGSTAVYGHWLGPVRAESMFAVNGLVPPFVHHGWVLQPDGTVCDPTRWEFEQVAPYIYIGPADHYDEGGNRLRTMRLGEPPEYDPKANQFRLTKELLPTAAWKFVEQLLGLEDSKAEPGIVSYPQLHWLGNQDPQLLGVHAAAIYAALDALQLKAIVPWDNQRMVERLTQKSTAKR